MQLAECNAMRCNACRRVVVGVVSRKEPVGEMQATPEILLRALDVRLYKRSLDLCLTTGVNMRRGMLWTSGQG
jgi:hypothetical protein